MCMCVYMYVQYVCMFRDNPVLLAEYATDLQWNVGLNVCRNKKYRSEKKCTKVQNSYVWQWTWNEQLQVK